MRASNGIRLRGAAFVVALLLPVAVSARVIEFSGQVQQGHWVRRQLATDLWFCLTPIPDRGRNSGWSIRIQPSCNRSAPDFAAIATPPYHGPTPVLIVAWFFDPGANAPHEVHDFRFVLDGAAYRGVAQAAQDGWEKLSGVLDKLAGGRGHMVVTAHGINPRDGSLRWFGSPRAWNSRASRRLLGRFIGMSRAVLSNDHDCHTQPPAPAPPSISKHPPFERIRK